ICTAQVLLAVMASMYAVYHGPEGLRRIAERVHTLAVLLGQALTRLGYRVVHSSFFDTLSVEVESWALPRLIDAARARRINLRLASPTDRKSTRLNSSHVATTYAVFCLKKKK